MKQPWCSEWHSVGLISSMILAICYNFLFNSSYWNGLNRKFSAQVLVIKIHNWVIMNVLSRVSSWPVLHPTLRITASSCWCWSRTWHSVGIWNWTWTEHWWAVKQPWSERWEHVIQHVIQHVIRLETCVEWTFCSAR